MADSRTASIRYLRKIQKTVYIQQKVIYFLLSISFAFGATYLLVTPELDKAQIYILFLLFLSIGLWTTEAIPPFAVGLTFLSFWFLRLEVFTERLILRMQRRSFRNMFKHGQTV